MRAAIRLASEAERRRPLPVIDTRVVRVRIPETIAWPEIRALIERAIAITEYPGTTPWDLYAEWAGNVSLDTQGIFVGFNDRKPAAVAVASLPTSHTMFAPILLLAYNEGPPSLARKVGAKVKAWVLGAGYDTIMAHNLCRGDDVFIRGFRHVGAGERVGSLIEFRLL